jgi:DNA topoisomerase-1
MYYIVKNKIVDENHKKVRNSKILERIRSIYIPPAYKNIIYHLKHDLLATGVDSKGRTQYIYSNKHKEKRKNKKKDHVRNVNKIILSLMKHILNILKTKKYNDTKYECAIAVQMILDCGFRIGHENNVSKYEHYGITTLRKKHIKKGKKFVISFIGKKGVKNSSCVQNKIVQNFIRYRMKNVKENERLFTIFPVNVNEFLEKYQITNKDLRTWRANVLFIQEKYKFPMKSNKEILDIIAEKMHNTRSVCKGSYLLSDVYEMKLSITKTKKLSTKDAVKILSKKFL